MSSIFGDITRTNRGHHSRGDGPEQLDKADHPGVVVMDMTFWDRKQKRFLDRTFVRWLKNQVRSGPTVSCLMVSPTLSRSALEEGPSTLTRVRVSRREPSKQTRSTSGSRSFLFSGQI